MKNMETISRITIWL